MGGMGGVFVEKAVPSSSRSVPTLSERKTLHAIALPSAKYEFPMMGWIGPGTDGERMRAAATMPTPIVALYLISH